jgi:hypothetical protein
MFFLYRCTEDRTIGGETIGAARTATFYADHALRMLMCSTVRRRCSCIHDEMIRSRRRPMTPTRTPRANNAQREASSRKCSSSIPKENPAAKSLDCECRNARSPRLASDFRTKPSIGSVETPPKDVRDRLPGAMPACPAESHAYPLT